MSRRSAQGRLSWDGVQRSESVLLGDLSEVRVWCPPPIEKKLKTKEEQTMTEYQPGGGKIIWGNG